MLPSAPGLIIRSSCSPTLNFNPGDIGLTPDMVFCGTRPELFVSSVKFTPSLAVVFIIPTPAFVGLKVYPLARPAEKLFPAYSCSLQVCTTSKKSIQSGSSHSTPTHFTIMHDIFASHQPCFTSVYTYADCFSTGFCIHDYFSLVFSKSFRLFRRQRQLLFTHPQRFIRGTHGRFLQFVSTPKVNDNDVTTAFLYKTEAEFLVFRGLAR